MPSVPRLSNPQVQEQGLANIRQTASPDAAAFGGGAAAAAVSKETIDLVAKIKQDADQVAVLDADQKMSAYETNLLYDPKAGAFNKKGKDSFGLPDTVRDEYKKKADEIAATLSNPNQRAAFARSVTSRFADVDRQIQKHVSVEMKNYDDETTNAYIANEQSAAALNYQDPERVQMAIQRQQAAVLDHANRNGMPEEWAKAKLMDVTSKTNTEVVSRMLANGDDLRAKEYYEKNKETGFTGPDAIKLEKDLEEGSLRGESQRQSDKIFAANSNNMMAAIEETKKIEDPKVRDATMERIKNNFALKSAAEDQQRKKMQTEATNILDKSGSIDDIPPKMWNQFELSERSALKAYAKARAEGKDVTTKMEVYYNLRTMAETPALQKKFMQENLLTYAGDLSRSDLKQMMDLQAGLHKGDDKTIKALDGFRNDGQIVEDAFKAIGKSPSKDAEEYAQFRRRADEIAAQHAQNTGKKPTNKEMQGIVDSLMVQGVTEKGILWDTKKRAYELQDGESIEITAKDIPRAERSKIEEALKRRGIQATEKAVVDLYSRKIQRMSGG